MMEDPSLREFQALKDVYMTARLADAQMVRVLLANESIIETDRGLALTDKGRRLLIRGTPKLWDTAA